MAPTSRRGSFGTHFMERKLRHPLHQAGATAPTSRRGSFGAHFTGRELGHPLLERERQAGLPGYQSLSVRNASCVVTARGHGPQ